QMNLNNTFLVRNGHVCPSKFSRKVDMIDYYKKRIPELNEEIEELQNGYKLSNPMNSVAVEFVNLSYAQVAFQQEPYDQPQYFTPANLVLSLVIFSGQICRFSGGRGLVDVL
ncbi:hypothetical protein HII13_005161, partial [Brettanomyces bruxellensis]